MKLQWKVALIALAFGAVMAIFVNSFLYHFLKNRDVNEFKDDARQMASLIRLGLLNTMINTGDYEKIAGVINEMQTEFNFEFRMIRSEHVIQQHGLKRNETPQGSLEKKALAEGRIQERMEEDRYFEIIYPFITDERCGHCHVGLDGEPTPAGVVNGAAVLKFDISEQSRATGALLRRTLASITVITILFFIAFLVAINRAVTAPMQNIAAAITALRTEPEEVDLPDYHTTEMKIMAEQVKKTAARLAERKRKREADLQTERERAEEIEKIIRSRAAALGLEVDTETSDIIHRLSRAVDEAKKTRFTESAFQFVIKEETSLELPNDPEIVPRVSSYLTSMVESRMDKARLGSVELAIDEALSNAIFHGNLEIASGMKVDDFDGFYDLANERKQQEPYASRKVRVDYEFDQDGLDVTIRDEGAGFDWRSLMESPHEENEHPHGRGLVIMRAMATRLEYNEKGNEVRLSFDFESL